MPGGRAERTRDSSPLNNVSCVQVAVRIFKTAQLCDHSWCERLILRHALYGEAAPVLTATGFAERSSSADANLPADFIKISETSSELNISSSNSTRSWIDHLFQRPRAEMSGKAIGKPH